MVGGLRPLRVGQGVWWRGRSNVEVERSRCCGLALEAGCCAFRRHDVEKDCRGCCCLNALCGIEALMALLAARGSRCRRSGNSDYLDELCEAVVSKVQTGAQGDCHIHDLNIGLTLPCCVNWERNQCDNKKRQPSLSECCWKWVWDC